MKTQGSEAERVTILRPVNLRRNRQTEITGLKPDDRILAAWENGDWRLLVESSNGVEISHVRLTPPPAES